jgi:hypothetical protein
LGEALRRSLVAAASRHHHRANEMVGSERTKRGGRIAHHNGPVARFTQTHTA